MTVKQLETAFERARALPPEHQEAIAALILAEIESEERWAKQFRESPDTLAMLANEALAEVGREPRRG